MRVAFAGTPEFAAAALAALHGAGHDIVLVLTQPDRPAGRGLQVHASAVKRLAQSLRVPVAQARGLRLDGRFADDAIAARTALQAANPDVMVVAAYGLILPPWALELPPHGCLNIHGSVLPRWRGAAPIQRAIEAGDVETGITVMQMDAGLDTGDILLVDHTVIASTDTAATLNDRLAAMGARLIVQALDAVAQGTLPRTPQPEHGVTYARKIDKSESPIDWREPAMAIERRIRAFDPFPGVTLVWQSEVVKVWRAAVRAAAGAPGRVLASDCGSIAITCGADALELLEVQRPGGRRIPAALYIRSGPGSTLRPGAQLAVPQA